MQNQKEASYDLKLIMEEIRASEGLPEGLSTEAQLWDEIMKKETFFHAGTDIYHFECEMKKDGTMVMRMFEYDIHIAISYSKEDEKGSYQIRFPHSAVLYLQNLEKVPDALTSTVLFSGGYSKETSLRTDSVPTIKISKAYESVRKECSSEQENRKRRVDGFLPADYTDLRAGSERGISDREQSKDDPLPSQ